MKDPLSPFMRRKLIAGIILAIILVIFLAITIPYTVKTVENYNQAEAEFNEYLNESHEGDHLAGYLAKEQKVSDASGKRVGAIMLTTIGGILLFGIDMSLILTVIARKRYNAYAKESIDMQHEVLTENKDKLSEIAEMTGEIISKPIGKVAKSIKDNIKDDK